LRSETQSNAEKDAKWETRLCIFTTSWRYTNSSIIIIGLTDCWNDMPSHRAVKHQQPYTTEFNRFLRICYRFPCWRNWQGE